MTFVLSNKDNYSNELIQFANEKLKQKLILRKKENNEIVLKIDKYIRAQEWYDFQVWSYDGLNLVIGGNYDLSYYHDLEITFNEVFFVSGFFQSWSSETEKPVIEMITGKLEKELNLKYEIERFYQLFRIITEDYKNDIIIASKSISFEKNLNKMLRKDLR